MDTDDSIKTARDGVALVGESKHEGIVPLQLQQIITSELFRRNLERTSKPHWSVTPSFWLLIIGTFAACIAAYLVVFPPPQAQQPVVTTLQPLQVSQPIISKQTTLQKQSPHSPLPTKDKAQK